MTKVSHTGDSCAGAAKSRQLAQCQSSRQKKNIGKKHLQDYLNACGLITTEDAGNALMKLCSIAGVMMVATVGHEEAVQRMQGVAGFVEHKLLGVQYRQQRPN